MTHCLGWMMLCLILGGCVGVFCAALLFAATHPETPTPTSENDFWND